MITPDEIRAVVERPSELPATATADESPLCIDCRKPLCAENWPLYLQRHRMRICREWRRKRAQVWRADNPEKARARCRSWYWSHLELSRTMGKQQSKRWREAHPREYREYLRAYRQANKKEVRASIKAWEKANPDRNAAIRRRASARHSFLKRSNGLYEDICPAEIFDRDHWQCKACKVPTPAELQGSLEDNAPTLDHVIPVSLGGPHTRRNLQCLCRKCNRAKHSKYHGQLAFA